MQGLIFEGDAIKAIDFESLAPVIMFISEYGKKKTNPNIWRYLQMHLNLSIFRDKSSYALRVEYAGPL